MISNATDRVAAGTVLAATRSLTKQYPGTLALDSVDFNICAGEVHALLGQNGAGKSTLIKILSGAVEPTSGSVTVQGEEVSEFRPDRMRARGIATIFQEFTLVPQLTIAENLSLGREPVRAGVALDRRGMHDHAVSALAEFDLPLDVRQRVSDLSVGEQQLLEIAKAITGQNARILILDEPTAALTTSESQRLFDFIDQLRSKGTGLIYISHRLDEVEAMADRVTVLRNGAVSAEFLAGGFDRDALLTAMLGEREQATLQATVSQSRSAVPRVSARALSTHHAPAFDLDVYGGEIVGLAGLVGSGRTEMLRAVFGADQVTGGEVVIDGQTHHALTPARSWSLGVALAPEDRKSQGLFLQMTLAENMGMATPPTRGASILDLRELARKGRVLVEQFGIRSTSEKARADSLSGGNQQKLLLGRALFADAEILLIDEPTRGVDVGAKADIWLALKDLARDGRAICVVSSEIEDLVGNVDRVLVVCNHRVTQELSGADINEANLLKAVEENTIVNEQRKGEME